MPPNAQRKLPDEAVQTAPDSPGSKFRNRITALLGAGLLVATAGCSGDVDDPDSGVDAGSDDSGGSVNILDCEAHGSEHANLISEWGVNDAIELESYKPTPNLNSDPNNIRLDYTGASPLDQSTFYKCKFLGGENCTLTVDAYPGTKYEAAIYYYQDHIIFNQLKMFTYPEDGEIGKNVAMQPFEEGDNVFVQVSSDPEGNGSYPGLLRVNPECQ